MAAVIRTMVLHQAPFHWLRKRTKPNRSKKLRNLLFLPSISTRKNPSPLTLSFSAMSETYAHVANRERDAHVRKKLDGKWHVEPSEN